MHIYGFNNRQGIASKGHVQVSLKFKLLLPLLAICLLGSAFLYFYWMPANQHLLAQDEQRLLQVQLESVGQDILPILLKHDLGNVYPILDAVKAKNASWLALTLFDEQGHQIYPRDKIPVLAHEYVRSASEDIRASGKLQGQLRATADFSARHEALKAHSIKLISVFLMCVLILGFVAAIIAEFTVRRPIVLLAKAADRLVEGDYDAPLPNLTCDATGILIQRFAAMRTALHLQYEEIENQFAALQKAQRESAEKSQQIISILEHTSDAYLALDANLNLTYVSSRAKKLLQVEGSQLLGNNIWDCFPELGSFLYKPLVALLAKSGSAETKIFYPPLELWLECHMVSLENGVAMYFRDIRKRMQAEQELRKSEENKRAILNSVADAIITTDVIGNILSFNPAAERIFGYSAHEAVGRNISMLMDADAARHHKNYMRNYIKRDESRFILADRELAALRKDGSQFPMEISVTEMWINEQSQFVGIARDITERKQAEKQLLLAEKIFESNSEGILVTDQNSRILRVNSAFRRITGYTNEEVIGQTPKMLSSDRHPKDFYSDIWRKLGRYGHWQGEIWNRRRSGEIYPEWLSISAVYNNEKDISHYVGIFSDITEKKTAEERIHHMAYHDPLTGLFNRAMFNMAFKNAVEQAREKQYQLAVMYVDLDHFKKVNDTLGHPSGDEVLKTVAKRLTLMLRDSDVVCRIGGDEFIILLQNTKNTGNVSHVAQNILRALSKPIEIDGHEFFIGASAGIALYPQDAMTVDELIQNADIALFRAKHNGRNTYQYYSQDMNQHAIERLELESRLRYALDRKEFSLYYQPQVDLKLNRIIGVEALVRLTADDLGIVSPSEFIPMLEDTGLIIPVGEWILRQACQQAKIWQAQGLGNVRIAVNISPRQFLHSDIVKTVDDVLRETQLTPGLLELEITESSIMEDAETNIHRLKQLADMGVLLAIDDFGTGYSSLAYLKRFPIHALKVDQSFVRNMHVDSADANIVAAVVSLGRNLGLRVIAEGVEELAQMERLHELECNEIQGYLISKPLSEQGIYDYLSAASLNSNGSGNEKRMSP